MDIVVILIFIAIFSYIPVHLARKKRKRFRLINSSKQSFQQPSKLKKKINKELQDMAVDQEHYLFLIGLVEGRISEQKFDKWVNSRKHEDPEVFKKLLKRPYKTRNL
ncbi:hypothetical protein [Alkalihalobacterium elongatum]|uniref:hypothetical protein n=1 Tax=Alkalihalobacterium elongatum TaxID=2675466 RepID=UPI001C1F3AD6|nr:hypothetical protein [Alkalihalobacterium elongatum]